MLDSYEACRRKYNTGVFKILNAIPFTFDHHKMMIELVRGEQHVACSEDENQVLFPEALQLEFK